MRFAVLQAVHPGADGAGDGVRHVQVGGDVGSRVRRLLHRGAHLGFGVALPGNRVRGAGDAAIGHDLDEGGTLAQFLAAGAAHLVRAVRHAAEAAEAAGPAVGVVRVVPGAEVRVAAGLGECLAAGDEAGAGGVAFLDRLREGEGRAAGVADGGEAAVQHAAQDR